MTGVMGFVAQCEICPQKAILTDQPDGWVCPRCTEVAEPTVAQSQGDCFDHCVGHPHDHLCLERLTAEKGQRTIAEINSWIYHVVTEHGFGDVDVAAAEPVIKTAAPPPPQPLTIPMSDPLAAAIVREVAQRPDQPLIAALVGGRTFQFTGYTQRRGEPLETVWINEADLRTNLERLREPILWGAPVDEPELPYKPPAKDHAYRSPVVPMSLVLIDDNEPEGRKLSAFINRALTDEGDDYPLGEVQG